MTGLAFGVNTLCHGCAGTGRRKGRPCGTCLGVGFIGDPPSTSHPNSQEAAASIKSHAAHQRSVVLAAIKAHGPVSDQRLEAITGLSGNSIRPRRGELEAAGLIEHAGKGTTTSGRTCEPVTVVRRPVLVWCSARCPACRAQTGTPHPRGVETTLSEVVTVDGPGITHACLTRREVA